MTDLATNLDQQSAASGGTSPDAETLGRDSPSPLQQRPATAFAIFAFHADHLSLSLAHPALQRQRDLGGSMERHPLDPKRFQRPPHPRNPLGVSTARIGSSSKT